MSRNAFTLVELVIVILIVGILGAVAAPHVINSTEEAMVQATLRDIDAIFDAAEFYMAQNGTYPANTDATNAPGDFEGYLPERVFSKIPPIGGATYSWMKSGSGMEGTAEGVVMIDFGSAGISSDHLKLLDEIYDDGDINTGAAQLVTESKAYALAIDYEPPESSKEPDATEREKITRVAK